MTAGRMHGQSRCCGVGTGSAAHTDSHGVGQDLGGTAAHIAVLAVWLSRR